jgi:hypothetical protein
VPCGLVVVARWTCSRELAANDRCDKRAVVVVPGRTVNGWSRVSAFNR